MFVFQEEISEAGLKAQSLLEFERRSNALAFALSKLVNPKANEWPFYVTWFPCLLSLLPSPLSAIAYPSQQSKFSDKFADYDENPQGAKEKSFVADFTIFALPCVERPLIDPEPWDLAAYGRSDLIPDLAVAIIIVEVKPYPPLSRRHRTPIQRWEHALVELEHAQEQVYGQVQLHFAQWTQAQVVFGFPACGWQYSYSLCDRDTIIPAEQMKDDHYVPSPERTRTAREKVNSAEYHRIHE